MGNSIAQKTMSCANSTTNEHKARNDTLFACLFPQRPSWPSRDDIRQATAHLPMHGNDTEVANEVARAAFNASRGVFQIVLSGMASLTAFHVANGYVLTNAHVFNAGDDAWDEAVLVVPANQNDDSPPCKYIPLKEKVVVFFNPPSSTNDNYFSPDLAMIFVDEVETYPGCYRNHDVQVRKNDWTLSLHFGSNGMHVQKDYMEQRMLVAIGQVIDISTASTASTTAPGMCSRICHNAAVAPGASGSPVLSLNAENTHWGLCGINFGGSFDPFEDKEARSGYAASVHDMVGVCLTAFQNCGLTNVMDDSRRVPTTDGKSCTKAEYRHTRLAVIGGADRQPPPGLEDDLGSVATSLRSVVPQDWDFVIKYGNVTTDPFNSKASGVATPLNLGEELFLSDRFNKVQWERHYFLLSDTIRGQFIKNLVDKDGKTANFLSNIPGQKTWEVHLKSDKVKHFLTESKRKDSPGFYKYEHFLDNDCVASFRVGRCCDSERTSQFYCDTPSDKQVLPGTRHNFTHVGLGTCEIFDTTSSGGPSKTWSGVFANQRVVWRDDEKDARGVRPIDSSQAHTSGHSVTDVVGAPLTEPSNHIIRHEYEAQHTEKFFVELALSALHRLQKANSDSKFSVRLTMYLDKIPCSFFCAHLLVSFMAMCHHRYKVCKCEVDIVYHENCTRPATVSFYSQNFPGVKWPHANEVLGSANRS